MGTRYCHHIFMCHKYHVKYISKQCNLDRLKSGLKRDTNTSQPVRCLCTPHKRTLFGEGKRLFPFESSVQFNLIYFQVRFGSGPLRCPSLTRLPVWEPIPGPLLTNHSCSAVRAQIISLRSDDLVVLKLPACGRE